jgi:hypothetical protein
VDFSTFILSRVSVQDFQNHIQEFIKTAAVPVEEGEVGGEEEAKGADGESKGAGGGEDESQDIDDGDTFDMKSLESRGNDSSTEGQEAGRALAEGTVSTAQDTKTSTGDDFSESILIPPTTTIPKLSPNELLTLQENLQETYQLLQSDSNKRSGVYSSQCTHDLHRYHDLSKRFYQQTQSYLLTEPQLIAEAFLAEYYHTLDHDLVSTRAISRFYETDSTINFGGIPDVTSRRKISRALVVSPFRSLSLSGFPLLPPPLRIDSILFVSVIASLPVKFLPLHIPSQCISSPATPRFRFPPSPTAPAFLPTPHVLLLLPLLSLRRSTTTLRERSWRSLSLFPFPHVSLPS